MDQVKFMMMANNMQPEGSVTQDENGHVIVELRNNQIVITHNYKKHNEMKISFHDNNDTYIIPSQKELEEIYRLHLANKDVVSILHDYCNMNLKKEN